jgi:hypothetical protein
MYNCAKSSIKQNGRHAHRKPPMFSIGHTYIGRMFEKITKHVFITYKKNNINMLYI